MVNSVITLSSPLKSPVLWLSNRLMEVHERIRKFWGDVAVHPRFDHLVFVSITGGVFDYLVWDGLADIDLPPDRAIHLSTASINQVWLSCDHLCILWCKQLVLRLNRALFAQVNATTSKPLESREARMSVFKSNLLSHPVPLGLTNRCRHHQRRLDALEVVDRASGPRNTQCLWVNRAGDQTGVYTVPKATNCVYLKIGPLTGNSEERVLLLPTNIVINEIFLCDKSINSVPCPTVYLLPDELVQRILVPGDDTQAH
uniref:GPI inositol-deacylase PGAP1-like alpha/beta domain-containing protein n=1 Tax=Mesocestoides corti TaxID=53468 RepID=A0A5K3FN20_MESCO